MGHGMVDPNFLVTDLPAILQDGKAARVFAHEFVGSRRVIIRDLKIVTPDLVAQRIGPVLPIFSHEHLVYRVPLPDLHHAFEAEDRPDHPPDQNDDDTQVGNVHTQPSIPALLEVEEEALRGFNPPWMTEKAVNGPLNFFCRPLPPFRDLEDPPEGLSLNP